MKWIKDNSDGIEKYKLEGTAITIVAETGSDPDDPLNMTDGYGVYGGEVEEYYEFLEDAVKAGEKIYLESIEVKGNPNVFFDKDGKII